MPGLDSIVIAFAGAGAGAATTADAGVEARTGAGVIGVDVDGVRKRRRLDFVLIGVAPNIIECILVTWLQSISHCDMGHLINLLCLSKLIRYIFIHFGKRLFSCFLYIDFSPMPIKVLYLPLLNGSAFLVVYRHDISVGIFAIAQPIGCNVMSHALRYNVMHSLFVISHR